MVVNGSGAKSTSEAIFEVKTFTACKSRYNFNNTAINHAADCRTKSVVSEYTSRFQNLDKHCAPDVVGDVTVELQDPLNLLRISSIVVKK